MKRYLPALLIVTLLAGCDSQQQRETRYLTRGQKYFDQGEFEKARLDYRNAARIAPADPVPAYRLGLADEELSNIGGAFGDFLHASELDKTYLPARLKLANYYLAGGHADEAKTYIDGALALKPNDPDARALNAALLLRNNDYEKAIDEANFALREDSKNITAYSVLAGTALAKGDRPAASKIVAEGAAKNPADLSLLLLQARIAQDSGDFATLDAAYRRMFALRPDFIQLRLDLANIYAIANRLDDAEATLRQAITAEPDEMVLRHALVVFLNDHRSMESAEQEIRSDMQADPANKDFAFWLADLYASHGQDDKAIATLQQIIIDTSSSDAGLNARVALARLYYAHGNKDLASQLVDQGLAEQPDNRDMLLMRAMMAYDNRDYQGAAISLRAILQDHENDIDAKKLLAETFLRQGYRNLAIEALNQISEIDPSDAQVKARLAQISIDKSSHGDMGRLMMEANAANKSGDYQQAIKLYEAILAQNPHMLIAANNLAAMIADYQYDNPARLDRAYQLAQNFNKSTQPELLDTLAWIYYRQNNIDQALATIRRVSSPSPEMQYHYGAILIKVGKGEEAKKHLQDATDGNSTYPGSDDAKKLLSKLQLP